MLPRTHASCVIATVLVSAAASAHEVYSPDAGVSVALEPDGGVHVIDHEHTGPSRHAMQAETVVRAKRSYTAASSSVVRQADFESRPMRDPSDILEVTPGLVTVQHAGGGKANQYFLRGFDLDHGTDLALSVDGVPVNMPSHGHGQGYADLHFVIPELVQRIEVTKGPYSAKDGDFATAGAIDFVQATHFHQSQLSLRAETFDTFRSLLIASPGIDEAEGYLAAELLASRGPFQAPEDLRRFNLVGHLTYRPADRTEVSFHAQAYGAGWNASGQIPLRAVEDGRLDRFGSVDASEGGRTERQSFSAAFHHHDAAGGDVKLMAYVVRYRFDLFSNFTFFANDPENGDAIEQTDDRVVSGFQATYRRIARVGSLAIEAQGGVQLRNDDIDNELFRVADRERLSTVVDARVGETALGAWLQGDVQWTSWLRNVLGLRADWLGFQVHDRLEDLSSRNSTRSGTAHAMRVSPKASLVVMPVEPVDVFVNFGRGFHSNDARGVVRGGAQATPMAAATGYEIGVRVAPFAGVDIAAAAWGLELDSELVWVGDEGTTEPRGATVRRGLELEARWRLMSWLRADVDFTYSRARFDDGSYIPLAPVFTVSGGVEAEHPTGFFGSARTQAISHRPANEDGSIVARGFTLVDLQLGYQTRRFRLALDVKNALNVEWNQAQFANESRLPGESEPVEDLHFTPGHPRTFGAMATLYF